MTLSSTYTLLDDIWVYKTYLYIFYLYQSLFHMGKYPHIYCFCWSKTKIFTYDFSALGYSMFYSLCFFSSPALREICHERPGQPSPRRKHHPAVRRDRGRHLLHPARSDQQKHGERQGLGRHGRHREAGQHHQGQRWQVCYSDGLFVQTWSHRLVDCRNRPRTNKSLS